MSNFVILAIEKDGQPKEVLINTSRILHLCVEGDRVLLYTDQSHKELSFSIFGFEIFCIKNYINNYYICAEPIHQVYAKLRSVQATNAFSNEWLEMKQGERK